MGFLGSLFGSKKKPAPKKPAAKKINMPSNPAFQPDNRAVHQGRAPVEAYRAPMPRTFLPPDPSFEMDIGGEIDAATDAELAGIEGQLGQLGRGQFDTARKRLQEDLARQLSDLERRKAETTIQTGLNTQRSAQDTLTRMRLAKQDLVGQLGEIGSSAAARGAFGSSGRTDAQGQAMKQVDRYVGDQQTAQQRYEEQQKEVERKTAEEVGRMREEANKTADRQLADLQQQQKEAELQAQAGAVRSRAAAAKSQLENKRGEATTWTKARVNELQRAGMPEADAQALSISEARQRWPQVGDTYISGSLKVPEAKEPVAGFSKPINGKLGAGLDRGMVGRIKKDPWYKDAKDPFGGGRLRQQMRTYANQTGSRSSQEFMKYALGYLSRGFQEAEGLRPDEARNRAISLLEKKTRGLSLIFAEEGFD